jgi:phosphate transport system protein
MTLYWDRELENLKKLILSLGALVEEQIQKSILSLIQRDIKLAKEVIERDSEIDSLEIVIEEECLKILALYQPVARELRFVVTVLKMNNDLERLGDLASNIASRAMNLSVKEKIGMILDFENLAAKALAMVKKSLDSLVNLDTKMAKEVCEADDEVDNLTKEMLIKTMNEIKKNPSRVEDYFNIRSISKNLERIADSATNIAEDVIYLCSGEIIRHHADQFNPDNTPNIND